MRENNFYKEEKMLFVIKEFIKFLGKIFYIYFEMQN